MLVVTQDDTLKSDHRGKTCLKEINQILYYFFLNKVKKGGERVAAKLLIMAEKIINTILI